MLDRNDEAHCPVPTGVNSTKDHGLWEESGGLRDRSRAEVKKTAHPALPALGPPG